jgi:predicted secreted protein
VAEPLELAYRLPLVVLGGVALLEVVLASLRRCGDAPSWWGSIQRATGRVVYLSAWCQSRIDRPKGYFVEDVPGEVIVRVGEEVMLRLPSLAGAGYRWESQADGDVDAVAVSLSLAPEPAAGARITSSRDEIVTIRGRRPGKARVRLAPRRSWEPTASASGAHELDVTVVPE